MIRKNEKISYGELIPLVDLLVDYNYQRPPREQWAKQEAKRLNERLLGTLEVSERDDGTFYVMDGQGRVQLLTFAGKTHARCNVHHGLTPQQEASFFRKFNRERSTVKPYHDFRAALYEGDEEAIRIDQTVESFGLKVVPGGGSTNGIASVGALKAIYRRGGSPLLASVLRVVTDSWGETAHRRTDGELLLGMSIFISKFGGKVSEDAMIRKFRRTTTPNEILSAADSRKYTARIGKRQAVAETLVDTYDSGKRTRRLRAHSWGEDTFEMVAA